MCEIKEMKKYEIMRQEEEKENKKKACQCQHQKAIIMEWRIQYNMN